MTTTTGRPEKSSSRGLKLNHWLGIAFVIYGVAILSGFGFLTTNYRLPSNQPPLPDGIARMLLSLHHGGALWDALWAAITISAGMELFRATPGARWSGMFVMGAALLGHLNRGFVFGATVALTPLSLASGTLQALTFCVLWKSRCLARLVEDDRRRAGGTRGALVALLVISALIFGGVLIIKARGPSSRIRHRECVEFPGASILEEGFTIRELMGARLAIPATMQVAAINDKGTGTWMVLATPDAHIRAILGEDTLGTLMAAGVGRALKIRDPFTLHRQVLYAEWNGLFLALKALAVPHFKHLQLTELRADGWRGMMLEGTDGDVRRIGWSVYNTSEPGRSLFCEWYMADGRLDRAHIERSVGTLTFPASPQSVDGYREEAQNALTQGRFLDAQFSLAGAYYLGDHSRDVAMPLAGVSAKLGRWRLAEQLTQKLLADMPNDREVEALNRQARAQQTVRRDKASP